MLFCMLVHLASKLNAYDNWRFERAVVGNQGFFIAGNGDGAG